MFLKIIKLNRREYMSRFVDVQIVQAVEKGSSASLRSIASLQRSYKYASARRFLARLAAETFLNSLQCFNSV
jgi:hypothetical protein